MAGLPPSIRRMLSKLGSDISIARRRRGISTALMAQRAFVSRRTLLRVEKGDPSVSMGIYASVLFVLGFVDRVGAIAESATDALGLALDEERLPKRVRRGRP